MSLPILSGKAFLLSDGVDLKFSEAGQAWARLPLVFNQNVRTDKGWETVRQIRVDATVFGGLAEYLTDAMPGRGELHVTGEVYTEDWEDKEGNVRTSVRMRVLSAAPAPRPAQPGRKPAAKKRPTKPQRQAVVDEVDYDDDDEIPF